MVCSVTQVEETKQMVRLLPFFVSTFIPSIMMPLVSTLFVSQGTTLQRDIGTFKIPPAGLTALVPLSTLITILLYDRLFVKMMRKWTGNPRGITLLQRMGIGNVVVILLITTASLVERYRLKVARENGVVDGNGGQVPLSIFILLPQFVLMGISDAFFLVAKVEFFYDQAPENMKSLGSSYGWATVGIGNYLSTFLLSVVSDVTKQYGHGWILNNLNASHLDYYYAFLALLCLLNFFFFLFLSKIYVYRAEVSDSMKVLAKEWKATTIRESNRNEQ